jgi:hypothetical protein
MASELDPVDKALNDDEKVVEVPPPKSKKVEEKAVMGETSMAPPQRERNGPRQDPHAFIHPGSRQREKAPGIGGGPDARREGFAYDEPLQAHFSQGFDPHRGFKSYYGDQRFETATAPYGNHPSGPFMSNLSVNLALIWRQLGSLQDVVR